MRKNRKLKDRIVTLIQHGSGVSFISKALKCSESLVRYHMKKRTSIPKMAKIQIIGNVDILKGKRPEGTVGVTLHSPDRPWEAAAKALRAKAVEFIECANKLEKLANGGGGL